MEQQLFDTPGSSGPADAVDPSALPLAARMRPRSVEDLVGQTHLLAPGTALYEALTGKAPHSMILYGPPGSGKTTIARLVASAADAAFEEHSAVVVGRPEAVKAIAAARERLKTSGRRTIYFLDEIHRFNKAQQDALLPAVEDGTIILIGATTENPFFEVNSALLSRTRLYTLEPLGPEDVRALLDRALVEERGLGGGVTATGEALDFLADRAGGDARVALAALETAAETVLASEEGTEIDLSRAEDAMQRRAILYDKGGDRHYDFASAFIKSMRSSDPDAALYYVAAMLEGGEDPKFIARRIVIFASEDVGNADPQALVVAMAAAQALEYVGLPEAQINLAQAVTYCSLAPRSKASYLAIAAATEYVRRNGVAPPPPAIRDTHYPGAKELGHGGYENAHAADDQLTAQQMLPDEARDACFYDPVDRGKEAEFKARLEAARAKRQP